MGITNTAVVESEPQPVKTDREIKVYQTGNLPNNRPIATSNLQVLDSTPLPNNRPIAASNLAVVESSSLPHNRPIFSRAFEDIEDIMGYLD